MREGVGRGALDKTVIGGGGGGIGESHVCYNLQCICSFSLPVSTAWPQCLRGLNVSKPVVLSKLCFRSPSAFLFNLRFRSVCFPPSRLPRASNVRASLALSLLRGSDSVSHSVCLSLYHFVLALSDSSVFLFTLLSSLCLIQYVILSLYHFVLALSDLVPYSVCLFSLPFCPRFV